MENQEIKENQEDPSKLKKPGKWSFLFKGLLISIIGIGLLFWMSQRLTEDLLTPVKEQFEALKENRVTEAYYKFTSPEFQKSTSLIEFRQFIEANQAIFKETTFEYENGVTEGNYGILSGLIKSPNGQSINIEYYLKFDEDAWKIMAIKFNPKKEQALNQSASADPEMPHLLQPIAHQLEFLKVKDIASAYHLTSAAFQKKTSITDFSQFIARYPILFHYDDVYLKNHSIDGDLGKVEVIISGNGQQYVINYRLIKEENNWKIKNLKLHIPLVSESNRILTTMEQIKKPILDQIEALKQNLLEDAYHHHVTATFKEVTPFEIFEDFFAAFPILAEHKTVDFGKVVMDSATIGTLQVNFYGEAGMLAIDYTLEEVKKGVWKILGIRVVDHSIYSSEAMPQAKQSDEQEFNHGELLKVIQNQLSAINKKEYQAAYQEFTAKGFRQATSFDTFETFMQKHPAFATHENSYFADLVFNNNVGTIKGVMETRQGVRYPIEYDMVLENGLWKILHIELFNPTDMIAQASFVSEKQHGTIFKDILVGTKVDEKGIIIKRVTEVPYKEPTAYVNVKLQDAKAGTVVTLNFKHLESKSKFAPISTVLHKSGDNTLVYVFHSPEKGWPPGDYRMKASTEDGDNITMSFRVLKELDENEK